ncbi:hypothetical protein B1218_37605, partial [Pseudomonas ogarae]
MSRGKWAAWFGDREKDGSGLCRMGVGRQRTGARSVGGSVKRWNRRVRGRGGRMSQVMKRGKGGQGKEEWTSATRRLQ